MVGVYIGMYVVWRYVGGAGSPVSTVKDRFLAFACCAK